MTLYRLESRQNRRAHPHRPFTGLIVGSLENPVALLSHSLCHLLKIDVATRDEIEAEIDAGEFDGYRVWSQDFSGGD